VSRFFLTELSIDETILLEKLFEPSKLFFMLNTSKRVNKLIASPIRKFLPMVRAAEKKGVKFFKLNVGDPDIFAPKEILRGIKGYNNRNIPYAPSPGISEHVRAWLKYYALFGIKLKEENIVPTVGGAEGILLALMAVADVGEEIIVFEPLYPSYKGFAAVCNVKLVPITLKLENNFKLPAIQEIAKKINKKTRALVIINPDNQTGKVWSNQELKNIIQLARKNNLFIIADETYREIVFKGKPKSILNFSGARGNTLVVDSLSKRFSAPGIRVGALVSYHQKIMRAILKMAMIRLSVPTVEQLATVAILKNSKKYTSKIANEYRQRRNVVNDALKKMPGVLVSQPAGAFYQVAKLPVKDAEDFIKFLITKFRYKNKSVLVAPLEDFYVSQGLGRNEIRIAYVLNVKELKEALEIFKKGLEQYLKK